MKTITETCKSKKQFKEELKEFRKISESIIMRAEKLRLIDKEKAKDLKKELCTKMTTS